MVFYYRNRTQLKNDYYQNSLAIFFHYTGWSSDISYLILWNKEREKNAPQSLCRKHILLCVINLLPALACHYHLTVEIAPLGIGR